MGIKEIGSRPIPAAIREVLSRVAVRKSGPLQRVKRQEIPYWQERGWKRTGKGYSGTFQTRFASFYGEIAMRSSNHFEFLLYAPSDQIKRHSHWVCFQHRGNDWFLVHMGRQPRDVSSGILTIERLITESYRNL